MGKPPAMQFAAVRSARLNTRTVLALAQWTQRKLTSRIKSGQFPPGKLDSDGERRWAAADVMNALKGQL
jgi:hypothetical protein